MSKTTLQLRVDPETAGTRLRLLADVSTRMGVDVNRIKELRIVKRSIDARQRRVMVNLTVDVFLDSEPRPDDSILSPVEYRELPADAPSAIVVGAGPAGLFASLRLIEEGIRPILLERGKSVEDRSKDMARLSRENVVDPDSNYCFGEGGAGAYSDGKLYTRSKKRGPVEKILNVLVQHGAKEDILVDAHPHIGTDRLPQVIRGIRERIIKCGGEVRFQTRVERLVIEAGRVKGVVTASGEEINGPVILATGHSARDVYRRLEEDKIKIEPKGIAVGVRVEHPQELIDRMQYHSPKGRGKFLPPAEYSMLTRVGGRGVYSFCMCPGGYVVNASSEPGRIAVNGMSYSDRGSSHANSAVIVQVTPEDYGTDGPLAGIVFQRRLEEEAFSIGNGRVPVQYYGDYKRSRRSEDPGASDSLRPNMKGAYVFSDLRGLLPHACEQAFIEGMEQFDRVIRGFAGDQALLSGIESRTSSPVRICRDDALQCPSVRGLYPCGEGAGYAGGITSAAMDGIRVAEQIAGQFL